MGEKIIKVALADCHAMVRSGMRKLLESDGFEFLWEAGSGLEAASMAKKYPPDVLITELLLPGIDGLEVTRHLAARVPATRIVVCSAHTAEPYIIEALRDGAKAYVFKESPYAELATAVRRAAANRTYLDSSIPRNACTLYATIFDEPNPVRGLDSLTPRERHVLNLMADGYTNKKIAYTLYISERTVEDHRRNMMGKMGFRNRSEMLDYLAGNKIDLSKM